VLHVFAEQRVAAGLNRGGDDQRVIEGNAVLAGEGDRTGVGVQGDGCDGRRASRRICWFASCTKGMLRPVIGVQNFAEQ
jgi:hypothetical protein